MVNVQPRSGKCLRDTTIVSMSDGTKKEIKDIDIGDKVLSLNKEYKFIEDEIINKLYSGNKECYKVLLTNKSYIEASEDHKVLTYAGWKTIKELTENDYLVFPCKLPEQNEEVFDDDIFLIAVWLAEGNKNNGCYGITNESIEIQDKIREIANNKDWNINSKDDLHFYLSKNYERQGNTPLNLLREYSVLGMTTASIKIPNKILKLNNKKLALFINYLFATDGCVNKSGTLEYTSKSEFFIRELQEILLRYGINSSIESRYTSCNGKKFLSWRLVVGDKESIKCFYNNIKIINKQDKLNLAYEIACNKGKSNLKIRTMPATWRNKLKYSPNYYSHKYKLRIDKKGTTHKDKVRIAAELENNLDLLREVNGQVDWVKIKSIENIGFCETYDIEVKDNKNFLANNIIVHNSEMIGKYTPSWYLGVFPDKKVIYTSYEFGQAQTFGLAARELFEEHGKEIFGLEVSQSKAAAHFWKIEDHDGAMVSVGAGGALMGKGADLLIIDDPYKNDEEANSATTREKIQSWFGCFNPGTEIYTKSGWKSVTKVYEGDFVATMNPETRELEFLNPTHVFNYKYKGNLLQHISSKTPSFCITPNHNVYFAPLRGAPLERREASELPDIFYIPVSVKPIVQEEKNIELSEFLGWFYRTGSIRNNIITFSDLDDIDITVLRAVIEKLEYKITKANEVSLCVTVDKFVSIFIHKCKSCIPYSIHIKSLIKGICKSRREASAYHYFEFPLDNKKLSDHMFRQALLAGYSATYKKNKIVFYKSNTQRVYRKNITQKMFDGRVYCLTVPPYHTVLTKYKGKVSWSGQSTAYTRLMPGASIVIIQTRWHTMDLSGWLLQEMNNGGEKWEVLNFPAIAEQDEPGEPLGLGRRKGEVLWPEMWSLEDMLRIKNSKALSAYMWASLYQQNPIPDGGGFFKKDWFRYYEKAGEYFILDTKDTGKELVHEDTCYYFITADTANKPKNTSDFTVIMVWAVDKRHNLILLDIFRDRVGYEVVLKKMMELYRKYKVDYLGIENVGTAIRMIEELRNKGFTIRSLEPRGKGKENRANNPHGAVIRMSEGQIFFPKEHSLIKDVELEILNFPKGAHDDVSDCLAYAANEVTRFQVVDDQSFIPYRLNVNESVGIKKGSNGIFL